MRLSSQNHPLRRSQQPASKEDRETTLMQKKKNLMLNSFSTNPMSQGVPIEETLEEALIDLYLSVKIRSNDEIDDYNEEMLTKEREKLRDTDAFTVLEYVKSSIEILMNMKMDEAKPHQDSAASLPAEDLSAEFETQLQKYEAEVRNHIKIE